MRTLRDVCLPGTVLYGFTSILIGIFLVLATRYAQNEIHQQGGGRYEFSFCLTAEEHVIPEIFFEETDHVALLCYERQNPMDYVLLSGEEALPALEESYETLKRGGQTYAVSQNTIFWAVSGQKKDLEKAVQNWENWLAQEGKRLEPCQSRRITASGLLKSSRYVYLFYGITWTGLLLFQFGNLTMYIKGRKRTVEVYFLLGIPGYVSRLKKSQAAMQMILCFGGLVFLKGYCLRFFAPAILLFYLLAALWSTGCAKRCMGKNVK